MPCRTGLASACLLLAGAAGLAAQTSPVITFDPAQPVAGQTVAITVTFTSPFPCYGRNDELPVLSGTTITLRTGSCPIGTPPPIPTGFTDTWQVGPLAAGTYTVRFLFDSTTQKETQLTVLDCTAGRLCLNGGRFEVATTWDTGTVTGVATPLPITTDTGAFWFFQPDNVETMVKVLNGCALNNHFWVFAAGLTNVGTETTVTDTQTGAVKTYRNPRGTPFAPLQDTAAFTCN